MKKILVATLALMVSVGAFAEEKITPKPDHVLGTVNGEKFYMRDWSAEFSGLEPRVKSQGVDALLIPLRDAIVNKMAMSASAIKAGLDKTDVYKAEMAKARRDILSRLYLDGKVPQTISDKQAEAEYKVFKKEFIGAQQIHARHILVKTRKDADLIIKALKNGTDFAELAKAKSTGPSATNGGDLGFFARGQMVPAFEKSAFKLKDGEFTKRPVKTQFGWHIIKREETRKQTIPAFKDVKDGMKQRIYQKALSKVIDGAVKKSKITLYDLNGNVVK